MRNKKEDKGDGIFFNILMIAAGKKRKKPDYKDKGFVKKTITGIADYSGVNHIKNSFNTSIGRSVSSLSETVGDSVNLYKKIREKEKEYSSYRIEMLKYKRDESFVKHQYTVSCYCSMLALVAFVGLFSVGLSEIISGDIYGAVKNWLFGFLFALPLYVSYTTLAYQHNERNKFESNWKEKYKCFKSFNTAFPFPYDFKREK